MNDKEFYEQLGKRIKARREELGMSQEQLAEKIGYKGKSTISMIEAGTRGLRHSKVMPLAEALQTTTDYIMGWERLTLMEEISGELNDLSKEDLEYVLSSIRSLKEQL